jgi:hypothetical protein
VGIIPRRSSGCIMTLRLFYFIPVIKNLICVLAQLYLVYEWSKQSLMDGNGRSQVAALCSSPLYGMSSGRRSNLTKVTVGSGLLAHFPGPFHCSATALLRGHRSVNRWVHNTGFSLLSRFRGLQYSRLCIARTLLHKYNQHLSVTPACPHTI